MSHPPVAVRREPPVSDRLPSGATVTGTSGATAVWWWPIGGAAGPADLALLRPSDHERLARIRTPARAAEFIISRARIRTILSEVLDVPPDVIELGRRRCPCCADPDHGPPTVLQPPTSRWIGISHTEGCGLLAVSDAPVGVDVERVRAVRTDVLASVVLTRSEDGYLRTVPEGIARERAFLRVWTRKEAVLKAVGIGISTDLTVIETHPRSAGTARVVAGLPGAPHTWSVSDLSLPGPWVASVARHDGRPGPVELRRA
ncbi:4'-phosphopantetheinyl transferase family protein [Streptomyces sp. H39-S7]|uniref:4'-phosphopantetheinyl transferase family protein n=1 Tax=Streptomyces sp. H39-S7 TaxID=3004357 RepID=UPI0022AE9394|nr:4'-phosphopantetheinyl transferase superfamily protein [Streptomyces sp. H39-S7]MCZ4123134.1 4'-phosphopantetheinyl transferase superfamily protein [Streptomyces sp. H39-S7]